GKLESTLDTGPAGVTNFAFSPDLLRFVVVGHDGAATYFNGRTNDYFNRRTNQKQSLGSQGVRVAFGPDGKHFAVAWTAGKDTDRKVRLHDGDGKVLHALPADGDEVLTFTPDGKTLMAIDKADPVNVSRWNVADGEKLSSVRLPPSTAEYQLVCSPDSKTLAR